MHIVFDVKLPATVKKKKNAYLSCCPILDICSQGSSKNEALKNLSEALQLFLMSCHERGTLDEVLKECGFTPDNRKIARSAKPFPHKYESLNVPLPFMIKNKGGAHRCHTE